MPSNSANSCTLTYFRGPRGQVGLRPAVFPDDDLKGNDVDSKYHNGKMKKTSRRSTMFLTPMLCIMVIVASLNFRVQVSQYLQPMWSKGTTSVHEFDESKLATCMHRCQSLLLVGDTLHYGSHHLHEYQEEHDTQTLETRVKYLATCKDWCGIIPTTTSESGLFDYSTNKICHNCPNYSSEYEYLSMDSGVAGKCTSLIKDFFVLFLEMEPDSQGLFSSSSLRCAQHNFLALEGLCSAVQCAAAPIPPGEARGSTWRQIHTNQESKESFDRLSSREYLATIGTPAQDESEQQELNKPMDGISNRESLVTIATPAQGQSEQALFSVDNAEAEFIPSEEDTGGGRVFRPSTDIALLQPFEEKLVLWLKADSGVFVDQDLNVMKWVDQSPWSENFEFVPTSEESHVHDIFGHVNHESENGEPKLKEGGWTIEETQQESSPAPEKRATLPVVSFPCALENKEFKLHDFMTIFIVLEVDHFSYGRYAKGQRFFGHYPSGQFRFLDGAPDMFLDKDYPLEHLQVDSSHKRGKLSLNEQVPQGVSGTSQEGLSDGMIHPRMPILLKYRFSQDVEIGVNMGNFFQSKTKNDKGVQFSQDSDLTIGGVRGGCEFQGRISEIMVYDEALNDLAGNDVSQYLIEKWFPEHVIPEDVDRAAFEKNAPVATISHVQAVSSDRPASVLEFAEFSSANPLQLWLRADQGVALEAGPSAQGEPAVAAWTSQAPGTVVSFVPAHRSSVAAHRGPTRPVRAAHAASGLPTVRFPCALEAPGVQLRAPATVFLVLAAGQVRAQYHGEGQRFFGHFPNGEFRFFNGRPVFTTPATDWSRGKERTEAWAAVPAGAMAVLSYSVSRTKVVVRVNGNEKRVVAHDGDVRFSTNGKLTIGGSNSGCGFQGEIGEVMVFRNTMKRKAMDKIFDHLKIKWAIRDTPVAAATDQLLGVSPHEKNNQPKPPLPTVVAAQEGGLSGCPKWTFEQDILDWVPPASAKLEMKMEWDDKVAAARKEIEEFLQGGKELHKFLREKVKELNRERERLFTGICDPGTSVAPRSGAGSENQHKPIQAASQHSETQHEQQQVQNRDPKPQSMSHGYVLPPQQNLRSSRVQNAEKSLEEGLDCDSEDVYDWMPPEKLRIPRELRMDWEDFKNGVHESVVGFQRGGQELKNFIRGKIREMLGKRRSMFSKYCKRL